MKIQKVESKNAPKAVGPYSQAIIANGFLYTAGQIALNSNNELIKGDIKVQMHQVMENLQAILKEAGLDFQNVVKTEVLLSDIDDYKEMNEVYAQYVKEPFPARCACEVSNLPLNVKVEIAMIACMSTI